jgi:hypothetical protein
MTKSCQAKAMTRRLDTVGNYVDRAANALGQIPAASAMHAEKSKRRVAGKCIRDPMIPAHFATACRHSGANKQDYAAQADIKGRAPIVRRGSILARQSLNVFHIFVDHATQAFMRFQNREPPRREIQMGADCFPPIIAALEITAESEGRCRSSFEFFRVFGHSRCASLRPSERDADAGQSRAGPQNRQKERASKAREARRQGLAVCPDPRLRARRRTRPNPPA